MHKLYKIYDSQINGEPAMKQWSAEYLLWIHHCICPRETKRRCRHNTQPCSKTDSYMNRDMLIIMKDVYSFGHCSILLVLGSTHFSNPAILSHPQASAARFIKMMITFKTLFRSWYSKESSTG